MAGGPNAAIVMCLHCAGKAVRAHEGIENDLYRCEDCGGNFGIDWSDGQPEIPRWPPSPDELEQARRAIASRRPGPRR